MGGQVSSCLSANCTQDTNHNFSEVLSTSNEVDTLILDTDITNENNNNAKTVYTPREEELFQLKNAGNDLSFDELSNSDTMSQQSVLSTISPTKDRSSPKHVRIEQHHPSIIDGLNLSKFADTEQYVAAGDGLYELISNGQCEKLALFAKLKNVDLRSVIFEDRKHTCLHVAVLHNQLAMVKYLLDIGAGINARNKEGFTALGLAYELSSQEIISLLISAKSQEFSGSPYSPYALSVASATRSLRSYSEAGLQSPSELVRKCSFDLGDGVSVGSATPTGAWNTPNSQLHSARQIKGTALTAHSPYSYRMELTPNPAFEQLPKLMVPPSTPVTPVLQDSTVRRRMTMLSESLDRLAQTDRHRSISLPGSSPVFAEVARARSPTDPPAPAPMIAQFDCPPSSEDQTPMSARSDDGSEDTGASTLSASTAIAGDIPGKKARKPLGTRLRKAAGRAMALIVPSRGMPPRPKPPVPRAPTQQTAALPVATHITLSIAVDFTTEADGSVDYNSPVLAALDRAGGDQLSESTSSVNGESVFTDVLSHD